MIPVTLTVPASGVVYLAVQVGYGLKGSCGYTKNAAGDAVDCATGMKVLIPNCGRYTFLVGGALSGNTSIQNYNVFKRNGGYNVFLNQQDIRNNRMFRPVPLEGLIAVGLGRVR